MVKNICYLIKKTLDEAMTVEENIENVSVSRKTQKRARNTKRISEFVRKRQIMINEDTVESIRSLLRELNVAELVAGSFVHEKIGFKFDVIQKYQHMSGTIRECRADEATGVLFSLKYPRTTIQFIFIYDEVNPGQDRKMNKINGCRLCADVPGVSDVLSKLLPRTVMVIGVISTASVFIQPSFFE